MAVVEALPYQNAQDDQETAITMYLDSVPIVVRTSLLRAFLAAQMPTFDRYLHDPKAKLVRGGFIAAARLAWDFWLMPKVKRGEMPPVDVRAMRADIVTYTLNYFSDAILAGLASTPWELLYVEQSDGALELTGMAPASEQPADTVAGLDDGALEAPAASGAADDTPAGAGDRSESGGPLVRPGHIGERENDVGETVTQESTALVALDEHLRH